MPIERFQYHAFATGLGGHITQPFNEILQVQAATALPESGGFGSSRVENFRYHEIISFASATAVVTGSYSQRDHTWDALATVTIEGLNILSTITADRVVARISSTHPDDPDRHPFITPRGSYFENLRIGGHPAPGDLDTGSGTGSNLDRYPDLTRDRSLCFSLFPEHLEHPYAVPEQRGVFFVPGFGRIRLAQFQATPTESRLTMVRIELGSTPEGNLSAADVASNGSPWTGRP